MYENAYEACDTNVYCWTGKSIIKNNEKDALNNKEIFEEINNKK